MGLKDTSHGTAHSQHFFLFSFAAFFAKFISVWCGPQPLYILFIPLRHKYAFVG